MKSRIAFFLFLGLSASSIHANPPTLPNINTNNVVNITSATYGAIGDGSTDNTTAIQAAINAAAALSGGGTVEVPAPGIFLSGPLTLKSKVNLQIDSGATLEMLPMSAFTAYSEGTSYFIYADNVTDVEISGGGTIDGQGAAWWSPKAASRPYMVYFNKVNRVLVQNVTLQNPPEMHMVFKSSDGNITVQGITINTPASPNTDGIDLVGTNCLVQNCFISDGDDNIALGSSSSSAVSSDILITNCAFGIGHGVSIGSNTAGGVSNLTVINCTFNGTDYGIRMKSDDNTSGGSGEGGIAQNLSYYNLGMTNIVHGAIVIYSYYSEYGTPSDITPSIASTQQVDTTTIPVWRNITISNVTATVASGGIAGIIWGRTEVPVTNVILSHVNITAPKTFDIYNAHGVQFADSQVTVPDGNEALTIYNAGITLTNDVTGIPSVTLDGLTSANSLALYNASLSTTATDLFGANPITLDEGTLIVSNNLILPDSTALNFALGTNASEVTATGNLSLNSTINVTNADGFGAGSYTLFTYGGNFNGNPILGTVPTTNFNYSFDTDTAGKVKLTVTQPGPSLTPVNLTFLQSEGNQLQISWPSDHIGWHLEIQTNASGVGLTTNWTVFSGSYTTNQMLVPIDPANGSVFLRLAYP